MKKIFSILRLAYEILSVILDLYAVYEWLIKLVGEVVNYNAKIIRA
jgi:hypothetical protein